MIVQLERFWCLIVDMPWDCRTFFFFRSHFSHLSLSLSVISLLFYSFLCVPSILTDYCNFRCIRITYLMRWRRIKRHFVIIMTNSIIAHTAISKYYSKCAFVCYHTAHLSHATQPFATFYTYIFMEWLSFRGKNFRAQHLANSYEITKWF